MSRSPAILLVVPIVLLGRFDSACAQGTEVTELDRWTRVYAATAAAVRMEFADGEPGRIELMPQPLLKYANPVRGVQQHGTIHLWTVAGRPAVVGSMWSRTSPNREEFRRMNFEWHTLADRPVSAKYGGETVWRTERPGLEWLPLAETSPPAESRPARLLQTRRIASRFGAEIERGESELRLLPRPLFRYAEKTEGVVDGAMFAFVMGTDPEFFLLIEAHPGEKGTAEWRAGIVRFTNSALEVSYGGESWWSCERFRAGPADEPYFLKFNVLELPADLAGSEFDKPATPAEPSETSVKEND